MIIGTAGHIDHGKTALVRALTGIDADRLPVDDWQLVAQLIAEVTLVPNTPHGGDKITIVLIRLTLDNTVIAFESADAPILKAFELATKVRQHLQRPHPSSGFVHGFRAFVRHERRVDTRF